MKKRLLLGFVSFLCLSTLISAQNVKDEETHKFVVLEDLGVPLSIISENNKYIGGTYYGKCVIHDTETEEIRIIERPDMQADHIYAILNDGTIIGRAGTIDQSYPAYCPLGEDWLPLNLPDRGAGRDMTSCNLDASIFGGSVVNPESKGLSEPCIWIKKDNDTYELQLLPYPEIDFYGEKPQWSRVDYINQNGDILIGPYIPSRTPADGYIIIWRKTPEGYIYEEIGKELLFDQETKERSPYHNFTPANHRVSSNGEYITLSHIYLEVKSPTEYQRYQWAMVIHLNGSEKSTFTTLKDPERGKAPLYSAPGQYQDEIWGIQTTNDGITFGSSPQQSGNWSASGVVYDKETSSYKPYEDWILAEAGINIIEDKNLTLSGCPFISGDKKLFGGSYTLANNSSISYYLKKIEDPTSIKADNKNNIKAFFVNNQLHITQENLSNISVYDIAGNTVYSGIYNKNTVYPSKGIYLIKVSLNNGTNKVIKAIN